MVALNQPISEETPICLLEDIRNLEGIFQGYKLAFDVICILAEAGDDKEYLSIKNIVDYLDPHLDYDCESVKEFRSFIKEIIDTFHERHGKYGFCITQNSRSKYQLIRNNKDTPEGTEKVTKNGYSKPKSKLVTNVALETKKKVKLARRCRTIDKRKELTAGDVMSDLVLSNYPEEFEEIVEQIREELKTAILPDRSQTKVVRITKPSGTAELIYKIANELKINISTVVEIIAHNLPTLEERDGEIVWLESANENQ